VGGADAPPTRTADALYRCYVALARAWIERDDFQLASTIAESAIELDPYREVGYRLAIEAELCRGDRGAALMTFERCQRTFADELGVSPSAETAEIGVGLRA
jgi:DNA-binding SARP family transcriptional activator